MASPPPARKPINLLAQVAALPFSALNFAATEPVVTGGLLYLLTRGPTHVRERILQPFQTNLLSRNGAARLALFVTALKVLTGFNVVQRINRALNRLSLNNWSFGRPGAPFQFDEGKSELVVVTGGSSGIGYELVKGFSKKARVVAIDINPLPEELAQLPDVHFYRADVTDTADVVATSEKIRVAHGNPSVLVNNAGTVIGKTILDTTNEQSEKLIKLNLISHFVLIREFLPAMLQAKKGHIVTISSGASYFAAPGLIDYCVSKVGALFLNDGLRLELRTRYEGGEGVCTTSVHPEWHSTGLLKGTEKALNEFGVFPDPPSNVADAVVEQVFKARSGNLYIPESGRWRAGIRNWPGWIVDLLVAQTEKGTGIRVWYDQRAKILDAEEGSLLRT